MSDTKLVDPKGLVTTKVYNKTLIEINNLRKKFGQKPLKAIPKGEPGESNKCPIQRALASIGIAEVSGSTVEWDRDHSIFTSRVSKMKKARQKKIDEVNRMLDELSITVDIDTGAGWYDLDDVLEAELDALIPGDIFSDFVYEFDRNGKALCDDNQAV